MSTEQLIRHRYAMEQYDGAGMLPYLSTKDLDVAGLVFVMKSAQTLTALERTELMMEWGVMCDHPAGHRHFDGKRRWFLCKLCESYCIFKEPITTAPVIPGPGPNHRMAAAA